jgi:NitT/TauT family transport system substrate-binding protein
MLKDWKSRTTGKVQTGLLENSIVYYITERMLQAAGADPGQIELIPIVQLPARLEMLLAGRVEAACLPKPLATMAASRGAHRLAESDGMGTTPGVILFTKKALAQKGDEIKAFYRAYDASVDEVNANPEAYREAIVISCDFPPAVSSLMQIPRFRHACLLAETQVRDVSAWMKQKGLVSRIPFYTDVVVQGYEAADARTP